MLLNCIESEPLPVYGSGSQVRDWIFVEDHCRGVRLALERGTPGETYLFGGRSEMKNLDTVHAVGDAVDELLGRAAGTSRALVRFVADRPGHDVRYAIDPTHAETALGWTRRHDFSSGLRRTVKWYLENPAWCAEIASGRYRRERLGLRT
jgi:dTDP-glucose 4,6-dehydratase